MVRNLLVKWILSPLLGLRPAVCAICVADAQNRYITLEIDSEAHFLVKFPN